MQNKINLNGTGIKNKRNNLYLILLNIPIRLLFILVPFNSIFIYYFMLYLLMFKAYLYASQIITKIFLIN